MANSSTTESDCQEFLRLQVRRRQARQRSWRKMRR